MTITDTTQVPGPIFIVAPQRAVGPFLARAIGSAPGVVFAGGWLDEQLAHYCGDRDRLTTADATADVVATLRRGLLELAGPARLIDASPRNVMRVPFLHAVFPNATFLFVYREPNGAVREMRGNRDINVSEFARRWSTATSIVLDDLERLPRHAWFLAPYKVLVETPEQIVETLTKALGLTWDGTLPERLEAPAPQSDTAADTEALEKITAAVHTRARTMFARGPQQTAPKEPAEREEIGRSFASPGFGQLLRELRITLAVTTYQSGRLIFLRGEEDGSVATQFHPFRSPMGMALRAGRLVLGTQREIWEYRNVPTLAAKAEPGADHDACFLPRRMHVTGDIRVHELAFAGGDLWLLNTRFSALCTLDGESSFVPRWRPPFVTSYAAEDRCHLNGMAVVDDRIRYCTALGQTDTAGGWRADKATGGILIDVDSGETVLRGLSMPHSPRLYKDRFYVLESGKGTIATADLARGSVETVQELPGFTRGLAFAAGFAFIGLSQVRESNQFGGIPLLERVPQRECGIYVVDLRSGATVAALRFEGKVQEIFDVQVVPNVRKPQLVDVLNPLVVSSFGVPDELLPQFA